MPLLSLLSILNRVSENRVFQFFVRTRAFIPLVLLGMFVLIGLGVADYRDNMLLFTRDTILKTVGNMELALLDVKLRYRADKIPGPHAAPSRDIVVIGIDKITSDYIRLHPEAGFSSLTLPRKTQADILNFLTDQGARAVIFDMEFKDPKEGDEQLAAAIRRHGRVYAADKMEHSLSAYREALSLRGSQEAFESINASCVEDEYVARYRNNPQFLSMLEKNGLNVRAASAIPAAINQQITRCYTYPTVNSIMAVLTSIGVPSIDYDEDAYIRSTNVIFRGYKGNFYTYLGVRPALDLLGLESIRYTPSALFLGKRRVPLQEGQKVIINWREPRLLVAQMFRESGLDLAMNPELQAELGQVSAEKANHLLNGGQLYRRISAMDVIRLLQHDILTADEKNRLYKIPDYPQTGPFSFKDKIVVIGNTVNDIHRTPMSNVTPGPEVVAAVLDMFLHDDVFIEQASPALQWLLVAMASLGIAIAIITFESLSIGFTVGIILTLLYWVLSFIAFVHLGLWFEMVLPGLTMGFSLLGATLYRYYVRDREKHMLTNVFSNYVSPQIMEQIVQNPENALETLKGGKKELTVLFADLHGFTRQFENEDPEVMVHQLNEYFDVMTEIILKHQGTYDKYMGDSIMAFFGAPTDVPNHAEMACLAAIEMQGALEKLNGQWVAEGRKTLAHGVGLASGEMFVGNFGSKNIKNFTVMGSNVNLGSRLEAYTRTAQWPMIISARTFELAGDSIQARDFGLIKVKGFSEPVQVYGLERVKGSA